VAVVDEQHRFGVEQRALLRGLGSGRRDRRDPDVLVMTATPIPRTAAMLVYGDLDKSELREMPPGRTPILTSVVGPNPLEREAAYERLRTEVAAGHQAYVVCPRIGDGEAEADMDEQSDGVERRAPLAVQDVLAMLSDGPLQGLRLAPLHGRLQPDEKDRIMAEFTAGDIDVLVATTVVEVGVDVPNATAMAVLDADRFGVSQLHRLRGRVGRGTAAGVCLLVTESPLDTPARARLDAVAATTDGFELARLDVEQRREGDVLGAAQSGRRTQLRLLSLLRDEQVITDARAEAAELIAGDPQLAEHPLLAEQVAALITDDRAEFLEKA
jgi:ATP-dependent DNA helicase RecG